MFETDVIGYSQTYVNRRKGKSAEKSVQSDYEFKGYKMKRIPDHVGGRDYDAKKRNFYEI